MEGSQCEPCLCGAGGACDPETGRCLQCPGNTEGWRCERCLPAHYGDPAAADCKPCNCYGPGSLTGDSCDADNGQCMCRSQFIGRTCDQCKAGHGNLTAGCPPCSCDSIGAASKMCDPVSGQCTCQPGVMGVHCNLCEPEHFGFTPSGCERCGCSPVGAVDAACDIVTGQCRCRPGAEGRACDRCRDGAWGLLAHGRCEACACDPLGARGVACDQRSGQCACQPGVGGRRCDACLSGFFGFSARGCRPCEQCAREGHVCDPDTGRCVCPPLTEGAACERCRPGAWGLEPRRGCKACDCDEQLLVAPPPASPAPTAPTAPLRLRTPLPQPLYWPLPHKFNGDRVLSYGGVLSFSRSWENGSVKAPGQYPLVQLKGNGLVLEHYSLLPARGDRQGIRMHESLWQLHGNSPQQVTRELLMLTLQKVEHILIQASPFLDFQSAIIHNVSLDTAIETPGQAASARGIELCSCPPEYNSTSCQDPSVGFYRWYSGDPRKATIIIQLIGEARPCQCNGRSQVCDIETGHCLNCSHNTGGAHCERCADGFYGEPDRESCKPCPCPSPHRNFASSCQVTSSHVICTCKPGYSGPRCERCAYGYYGFPREEGGVCAPCKCNPYGSVSDECDEETGQCNCKVDIFGRDCSYCQNWHVLTEYGCQSCNDSCTGVLLMELEDLSQRLAQNTKHIEEGDIPPPWQKLQEIHESAKRLRERLNDWLSIVRDFDNFPDSIVEEMKKKAKHLLNKANKVIAQGKRNMGSSFAEKEDSQRLFNEITRLHNDTNDVVQGLKNYGQIGAGDISVENALNEAQHLLNEIKKRNSTINSMKMAASDALSKSEDILNTIEKLLKRSPEVEPLRKDLEMLTSRLNSLLISLHGTSELVNKTKALNNKNKEAIKAQKVNVDTIGDIAAKFEILADEVKFLMDNAKSYLENATINMNLLDENMKEFAEVAKHLTEREGLLLRLNPLYKEQYVVKAQQHADLLYHRAQQYRDLFNSTKRDADFALRASRAYQGIVNALKTAYDSAVNASFAGDTAYKIAFPNDHQISLVQQSKIVEERSQELLKSGEEELLKVKRMKENFDDARRDINNVRVKIKNTEDQNNQILQELKKPFNPIQRNAEEAMMRAESALKMSQQTNATAIRVSNDVRNKLRPVLATLSQDEFLSTHHKQLISAQLNIKRIKELLEKLNQRSEEEKQNFDEWSNNTTTKLNDLRSKITQTRHTAEGIHLSLTSGAEGGCTRSYRLHNLTPSTTNTIVLNYAVGTDEKDASLFYLANDVSHEFMALEMVDRRIRFVWNAGGGVGIVVHPLRIETATLEEDKNWYHIKVQRTSNIATLSVRQQISEGSSAADMPVSNSSTPGFGIVDVRPGDLVWVGGLPPEVTPPPQLLAARKGLAGCLHRILLDGRPLGLWNFASETKGSCKACISGVEETRDESAYKFPGYGYSMHTINDYDGSIKHEFSITLNFKTFDENAILFIAVDAQKSKFVALLLENGHLVLNIGYGRRINMQLKTIKKVNAGAWIHCDASRVFQDGLEKALLSVRTRVKGEDEGQGEDIQRSPSEPPTEDDLPELVEFFLGGYLPGFQLESNNLKLPAHYLGCMTEILVLNEGVNPLNGKFFGVEASCTESYTTVSFQGQGYILLPPHPLKKKESSFEFVFRSRQRNAFLMLTEGSDGDFYSVSLQDGKIIVWVSSGGNKTVHQSKKEFSDGMFHSMSVTKKNRKLTLRVDEEDHGTVTMQGLDYKVNTVGPDRMLILGGLPPNKSRLSNMVASSLSLVGTIKDAIFNNQLIHFENHISFNHADIGRLGSGPLEESRGFSSAVSVLSPPTRCNKVAHYAVEPEAVKFGNSPESYIRKSLRPSSLQKNFVIEFSFRTYYPNGLLLIFPVQRKKESHYLMVALHNKQLLIELKGRKKVSKLEGQAELNDGLWHSIVLKRTNRQLSFTIDHQPSGHTKLPRRLPLGSELYLGGLPLNTSLVPVTLVETFKGCMRRLTINKVVEHLIQADSLIKNVRQCFPSVERGAYFPGDAYAMYDNEFQIRKLQEMELEFRTSDLTGILLSVAEPSGVPAISIELNNGKVVMRYDSGDGKPVQVEQSYPSNYTLCDNNWHSIHASFLSNGLFLKVDSLPNVTGVSSNGVAVTSRKSSSLFIGGVPEFATGGTLITREYFKGCIRNIVIDSKRKDWTDMAALENVHLNSCPLSD